MHFVALCSISALGNNYCLSLGLTKTDYEMSFNCATVIPHNHSVREIRNETSWLRDTWHGYQSLSTVYEFSTRSTEGMGEEAYVVHCESWWKLIFEALLLKEKKFPFLELNPYLLRLNHQKFTLHHRCNSTCIWKQSCPVCWLSTIIWTINRVRNKFQEILGKICFVYTVTFVWEGVLSSAKTMQIHVADDLIKKRLPQVHFMGCLTFY